VTLGLLNDRSPFARLLVKDDRIQAHSRDETGQYLSRPILSAMDNEYIGAYCP
jgi:hypothetical protein